MKVKDIIDNLENFDNGLLEDIIDQIESIKKERLENECYEIVTKLNKMIEPIQEIIHELDFTISSEIDFLVNNSFVVKDDDVSGKYIDFD